MRYYSLFVFYFVYFIMNGFSSFIPKYFGEIGLSDGMIGTVTSVSTIVAVAFGPLLSIMTDRVPKKRYMLTALTLMLALSYFLVGSCTTLIPLIFASSLYVTFYNSILPLANTISLEYTRQIGKDYGKIRLLGTAGYQAGALVAGTILAVSLRNLFPMMGIILLICCGITFMMPNIEGHQHKKNKVPLSKLFADGHVRWLYIIVFFGTVASQFYMAFFTKHLGDLGMSNTVVSWITIISVMLELPFLYFGDRIAKKLSVWNWLLIGILLNGIRWIGLAYSRSMAAILLFQIPSVTVLACYEYFPALYLNRRVPAELSGSAQNMLAVIMFGVAKVVGSFVGGQVCEYTGIPTMFLILGIMGIAGFAIFLPVTRKLIKTDTVETLGN